MSKQSDLVRQLGLMGLVATGVCSMMGASINVVPFMIQRNVEGIGPYVLPAFMVAAIPALLAAMAYAALASAMPRAGGSYIYASRGLHPYLGFIGSFSQWFGLSFVIGVIAYIVVPFLRDICNALGWDYLSTLLETGWIRLAISLSLIWIYVYVNVRGVRLYEKTLVPLMLIMFALGSVVIVSGFSFDHTDFETALQSKESRGVASVSSSFDWRVFFSAAALMFSSFIGFDSIAQAGGEAKRPSINLPRAIILAITIVGSFYFLFTAAVYHAVPWSFIAEESAVKDISAPGLLTYLLPTGVSVLILVGATIALIQISIEEGVKFFLTSLGKPHEIVKIAKQHDIKVYHDVPNKKVALAMRDAGVDGLNCINWRGGGQTGIQSAEQFMEELHDIGIPLICAGGIGNADDFQKALDMGYAGVQMGTRFLATHECLVTDSYKQAIVDADENDIVWTNKIAGNNSSVIKTADIMKGGLRTGPIINYMLRHKKLKKYARMYLMSKGVKNYSRTAFDDNVQFWQAGKGVGSINSVESVATVVKSFQEA